MSYPKKWEKELTLKSGAKVSLRPELPTDTEMLWRMFSTLAEASLSNLVPPFTRERVEGWTRNIDYDKVLTMVSVVGKGGRDHIIGSASLSFNPQEIYKHKAELGIAVHDDYQNMGVGTAMMRHLLHIAKMKKIIKVYLHVNTDNKRAIHVYKKLGFKIEGRLRKERCDDGQFGDEYRMAIFV